VPALDPSLSDMSGCVVAAEHARMDSPPAVRIASTGFGDDETAAQVARAEFDELLLKPVDIDALVALVRARLGAADG